MAYDKNSTCEIVTSRILEMRRCSFVGLWPQQFLPCRYPSLTCYASGPFTTKKFLNVTTCTLLSLHEGFISTVVPWYLNQEFVSYCRFVLTNLAQNMGLFSRLPVQQIVVASVLGMLSGMYIFAPGIIEFSSQMKDKNIDESSHAQNDTKDLAETGKETA